jgi:tripartite-type tricarboxylate transporter receptor subunit TctC
MKRRTLLRVAAGGGLCWPIAAAAQSSSGVPDYPVKPVRVIVPFPPGNPADYAARVLGERWSAAWGQPVVIDNVPGAAGTIGVARAAKAPADGYTVVMTGDAAAVTNVTLMPNLPYDPRRDFAPIMQVGTTPNLLVVRKDLPANNVMELVELARRQPGKLTYGSTGVGTSQHLGGEILCQMTGIEITHIPYKEPYINDLIAGRIDMGFANTVTSLQQVRAGSIRAIAISSIRRAAVAPDVPTVDESGVKGFNVTPWFGLMAPAGTPSDVVAKIHRQSAEALRDASIKAQFDQRGFDIIASNPGQFAELLKTEIPRLAEVIKSRAIKPD